MHRRGIVRRVKSGSLTRLGTPPDQAFEMMVYNAVAFAVPLPQMDSIEHLDVPPPIRDQARFLEGPSNNVEAASLHA
jgi:hypothetical protein